MTAEKEREIANAANAKFLLGKGIAPTPQNLNYFCDSVTHNVNTKGTPDIESILSALRAGGKNIMNKLTIFNSDVIPVYTTDTGEKVVMGRELHEHLRIGKDYTTWFKDMCSYGFVDGESYSPISGNRSDGKAGKQKTNHVLKFDMAKHIAMIQRTPQGFEIRQKLIELEKNNMISFPQDYASALRSLADEVERKKMLESENAQQKQIIGELKPKADYLDQILRNKGLVTITAIAKDYGMSGVAFNKLLHSIGVQYKQSDQWLLYSKYHSAGYTHSETVDITHKDGSKEVKMHTKWTQKGRLFLYNILKSNEILPVIEQEEKTA